MNTIITDEQITICNKQIYVIDHSQNKNRFIHIIDSVNGKKIEQIGIPFSSSINILFLREALILSHCFPTSEDPGLYAYFPQDEKIQILKQGYTVKNISNGDCLFTQSKKNDLSLCEIAVFDNKLKQNWLIEQMGLAFEVDNDFLYTNSINNILTPRINVFDIKTKTLTRSVDIPLKKIETLKASNGLLLVYGDYTRLLLDVYQGRIISPLIELTTIVAPPYFVKESRTAYMVVKDTRQKINTLYAYSI
jgi:hypothetical protein